MKILITSIILATVASCGKTSNNGTVTPPVNPVDVSSFTNPLLSAGPDPYVTQKDAVYYFTCTLGDRISIYPTAKMSQLNKSLPQTVYTPPSTGASSRNLWAPEMYFLQDKWYIYFAADDGNDANHRMYVLESNSSTPLSGFSLKGKLTPTTDQWAIDGTILNLNNQLYMLWSGWRTANSSGNQQIYIAAMSNPYTVTGERVLISQPDFDWEKQGGNVNEGPEVLINPQGKVFVTYSASSCFNDSYALGLLTLKANGNPMNPGDWTKSADPVLKTLPSAGAYGPGHNGFFTSPDGKENWIVYHANSLASQGCGNTRNPRMQKFSWNADGSPNFGVPVSINTKIPVPSGE